MCKIELMNIKTLEMTWSLEVIEKEATLFGLVIIWNNSAILKTYVL